MSVSFYQKTEIVIKIIMPDKWSDSYKNDSHQVAIFSTVSMSFRKRAL